MEEKQLLNDSSRVARETVEKGNEILGSLGRSSELMQVTNQKIEKKNKKKLKKKI